MKKLNGIFKFLFSLLIVATIFACEFPGGNPFDDEGWDDNIENNDSIPGEDDVWPNDSIPGGDDILPNDSIPGGDDILPNDTIPGDDNVWPNDTIPGEDNVWPNDTIPGEDNVLPNDSIVSSGEFHNGHALVDLGLSVKWATCNVGATKPEEFGGYYAWGETEEKNNYDWDTYKYGYYNEEGYSLCSKYCLHEYCGLVDNKTILDASDDVAHVKWGGNWRMPTSEEMQELREKCKWEGDVLNGVSGVRFTGPNGNSIFLPTAGYRGGNGHGDVGPNGFYWSASLGVYNCYNALFLYFHYDGSHFLSDYGRYGGLSVRPVCE